MFIYMTGDCKRSCIFWSALFFLFSFAVYISAIILRWTKPSSNRTLSHSHSRNVYMCAGDRASVCVCAFVWVVARSKWVVKLVYHVYYCWHFLYFYLDSRAANPSSQLCNITFARKHHQHIDEFQLHLNVSQIFLFRVPHIEIMMYRYRYIYNDSHKRTQNCMSFTNWAHRHRHRRRCRFLFRAIENICSRITHKKMVFGWFGSVQCGCCYCCSCCSCCC